MILASARAVLAVVPFLPILLASGLAAARPPAAGDLIQTVQAVALQEGGVAVPESGIEFQQGPALFRLRSGFLYPATPLGGLSREFVFVGEGVVTLDPPDEIEAGQLELFTGSRTVDAGFQEAVFLAPDVRTAALLSSGVPGGEAASRTRAGELWSGWTGGPIRKIVGAEGTLLRELAGDAASGMSFAAWVHSEMLDDFLYSVDPEADEPVTLGRFVPLETTKAEARRIRKAIEREQWRDHLVGLEVEDLGQFDTWMSACLRGADGKPVHGHAPVEPERYTIDVRIAKLVNALSGEATIKLRVLDPGRHAVALRLGGDMKVEAVHDGEGRDLKWLRSGGAILVLLAEPTREGVPLSLTVRFSGNPFSEANYTSFALRSPISWHPHAGTLDTATYDVTLRWPKKYQVFASGSRVDGGEEKDGYLWERRTIERPADASTFEIGLFTTREVKAGHVTVTLAFDRNLRELEETRQAEVGETVASALQYYEELFGPYPADELKVVTVPRGYSQGLFGFVTLSDFMVVFGGRRSFWIEDARTVIAHEIAHQWWGNLVGQRSYHDAWLSEGMANYAALLYQKHRIPEAERVKVGPTTRWKSELQASTFDGRPLESLGPILLGTRLDSSKSDDAYEAIVYVKGALVLDMLSKLLGDEKFLPVLKDIALRYAGKDLSTEEFLGEVGRKTFEKLDWFSRQYVRGTGIPDIHYKWSSAKNAQGKWTITGQLEALPPLRYRYRIAGKGPGFDLLREAQTQTSVGDWDLVIPFQIMIHQDKKPTEAPAAKPKKGATPDDPSRTANMQQNGRLVMHEPTKPFTIETEFEPLGFHLDRKGEVLARFFSEETDPRLVAYRDGERLAAGGKTAEAGATFHKAIDMPSDSGDETSRASSSIPFERVQVLAAHVALIRLAIDEGRLDDARAAIAQVRELGNRWEDVLTESDLLVLEARVNILDNQPGEAFKRLDHAVKFRRWGGAELQGLRAIAAHMTGHTKEEADALDVARRRGVDVRALESRSAK